MKGRAFNFFQLSHGQAGPGVGCRGTGRSLGFGQHEGLAAAIGVRLGRGAADGRAGR